jgi:hypothetical protein
MCQYHVVQSKDHAVAPFIPHGVMLDPALKTEIEAKLLTSKTDWTAIFSTAKVSSHRRPNDAEEPDASRVSAVVGPTSPFRSAWTLPVWLHFSVTNVARALSPINVPSLPHSHLSPPHCDRPSDMPWAKINSAWSFAKHNIAICGY